MHLKVVRPKNSAELKSPLNTVLKARQSLASPPLDFIRLPRKLSIFGAEHTLPASAMAHSVDMPLRPTQSASAADHLCIRRRESVARGGDPAGVVRLHHVGAGPADRPSVPLPFDSVCTT